MQVKGGSYARLLIFDDTRPARKKTPLQSLPTL